MGSKKIINSHAMAAVGFRRRTTTVVMTMRMIHWPTKNNSEKLMNSPYVFTEMQQRTNFC